jgi:hypothetical protein
MATAQLACARAAARCAPAARRAAVVAARHPRAAPPPAARRAPRCVPLLRSLARASCAVHVRARGAWLTRARPSRARTHQARGAAAAF